MQPQNRLLHKNISMGTAYLTSVLFSTQFPHRISQSLHPYFQPIVTMGAAQSGDGLTPHILLPALSAPLPLPATSLCPDPRPPDLI